MTIKTTDYCEDTEMKRASAIITLIIAVAVLIAAFAVGLGIKKVRVHRAADESSQPAESPGRRDPRAALPGGGERSRTPGLSPEDRAERRDDRAAMNERWENMSEEERRRFMEERTQRFDMEGRGDRQRRPMMSEEERQAMRERFENMTEEERQQFREEMRQRFSGRRRGGDRPFDPNMPREQRFPFRPQRDEPASENQDAAPEN